MAAYSVKRHKLEEEESKKALLENLFQDFGKSFRLLLEQHGNDAMLHKQVDPLSYVCLVH